MICDKCHIAEASVVVNHVVNGNASVFHFCDRCASEQGLLGAGRIMFKIPVPNFGLLVPSSLYRNTNIQNSQNNIENDFEKMIIEPFAQKEGVGENYIEQKISELGKEKDIAIKNEDYRSAAMLRDRIKELRKQLF